MPPDERIRAYHHLLKTANEPEALAATDALLAQLPKEPESRAAMVADLYWRAAECGQALAYARLLEEGSDPHPHANAVMACAGGHPDIVRHFLSRPEWKERAPDWTRMARSLLVGQGHEGVHPRAPEALAIFLADPQTKGLEVSHAIWEQIGIHPRAVFLPSLQEAYADADRANHPLWVLNAWAFALMKSGDDDEQLTATVEEVLLALADLVSEADALTWMASDLFLFTQYNKLGMIEPIFDCVEERHPNLPLPAWRERFRKAIGAGAFPEEVARQRQADLTERPATQPPRPRRRG